MLTNESQSFLATPITHLPSIGAAKARALSEQLQINNFRDLLYHFPFRYVDRRKVYTINELRSGMQEVQLLGVIHTKKIEGVGRKSRLEAFFSDRTGTIKLIWFKGVHYFNDALIGGKVYLLYGKPNFYHDDISIIHPELTLNENKEKVIGGFTPVYSSTEQLTKKHLDSRGLYNAINKLFSLSAFSVTETLPQYILEQHKLMPLALTLKTLHFPTSHEGILAAQYRIKFEELLYLQLHIAQTVEFRESNFKGYKFATVGDHFNQLYNALPFELTNAQKRVLKEIRQDSLRGIQMNRLVQGDVGSGKTLVALLSMLLAIDNGYQACMMAPTEILAQQHYETISRLAADLSISIELLTGSVTAKRKKDINERLSKGEIDILIGTHALIEPNVVFAQLGIAVIDEQHRFGVKQRSKLWAKNLSIMPHILIMSATPIPRTLAMTIYGDLDVSIIDELPPGRQPITTQHFYYNQIEQLYQFITRTILKGEQVYVVFPLIEGTEESDLKNVSTGYEQFVYRYGEKKVTFVHGKMTASQKKEQMDLFASGEIPILLSTTVIEVGVDVPNATVMVIFDAQRFGLSQLHQLRGRVGRGTGKSYCILLTQPLKNPDSMKRMEVMVSTQDGFILAEEDMKLRGFGDLEGLQQSGEALKLNMANIVTDTALVAITQKQARDIMHDDPTLSATDNQTLKDELNNLYPPNDNWSKIS